MMEILKKINDIIEKGETFLITSHERPDGDAIGAVLGLGHALIGLGKKVVMLNQNSVPRNLQFLPGSDLFVKDVPENAIFDVLFVLDCGELSRVGQPAQALAAHPQIINIDHHKTNDLFGHINYMDEAASSTGEMIWQILNYGNIPINADSANAIYTAIYTDTTCFRNANSTPDSYRICGEMVEKGADQVKIAREFYIKQSPTRLPLLAAALSSLQITGNGKIAGMVITQKDLDNSGATIDDIEGFVDYPRSVEGVAAAYLLRELPDGVKGSVRSTAEVDVAVVAESFGGGGHARAAGFKTNGRLGDVRQKLIEQIIQVMNKK